LSFYIVLYIRVFKNFKRRLVIAGIQLVSYIFLFGALQAEDYALLIGSTGLFVVVVLLMALTQKIDWYTLKSQGKYLDV
jgi:inner membrane protein